MKDRTAHEAARGRRVLKGAPGRNLTSEELEGLIREVESGSDRIAGVVCSALVQNTLIGAIITRLEDSSDAYKLFDISKGPFNTFYAQITAGKAFNLYNERVEEVLHTLRKVRNKFAHSVVPLDFTDAEITAWCEELKPFEDELKLRKEITVPRKRYEAACYHFTEHLLRKGTENIAQRTEILRKTVEVAPKPPEDITKYFPKLSDFLNLVPSDVGEQPRQTTYFVVPADVGSAAKKLFATLPGDLQVRDYAENEGEVAFALNYPVSYEEGMGYGARLADFAKRLGGKRELPSKFYSKI